MNLPDAYSLAIAFERLGVRIDKTEGNYIYIAVPSTSNDYDEDGNELSGKYLAMKIQRVLDEYYGMRAVYIKFKII